MLLTFVSWVNLGSIACWRLLPAVIKDAPPLAPAIMLGKFAQGLLYFELLFHPPSPEGKRWYKFSHREDSVTGAEVDPWFGYHGYLLSMASFANFLIFCMAP